MGVLYFQNKLSSKAKDFGNRPTAAADFIMNLDDEHKQQLHRFILDTCQVPGQVSFLDYKPQNYLPIDVVHFVLLWAYNLRHDDFNAIFEGTKLDPRVVMQDLVERTEKNKGYTTQSAIELILELDDDLLLHLSDFVLEKNQIHIDFQQKLREEVEFIKNQN